MGRSAKRYISIITVLLVVFMPMSTAFAAVSSLFSDTTQTQPTVEIASNYQHNHDSLEIVIDGSIAVVDETVVQDLLFNDGSHDNQGSGGLSVSIYTQISSDSLDWNYVYLDDGARYELTSVPLPAEIRPPIYL